ncbi:MAG: hypothetical protein MI700_13155 [Balneolales bacterium]|nr:hypothetical protein [Balneolales bacterium]
MAQTGGSDPQNSLLPEINPQDIEIRSEFRARFPGLRRQPILGFNPKPRVFQVDPNRMPFMETKDEAVASIAITQLDRPVPPAKTIIQTPLRGNVYGKAGIGNFVSPEAEVFFFRDLNRANSVSGNFDFRSTDGHLDGDNLSSFRYFDGDVQLNSNLENGIKTTVGLGFLSDFNRMYNLADIYQDAMTETANKNYTGFGGKVTAEKTKNALQGWKLSLSGSSFGSDLEAGATDFTGTNSETYFSGEFETYWPGNRIYETFSAGGTVEGGAYDSNTINGQSWAIATAYGKYKKMINFNLHVSANAGLSYASDGFSDRIYLAPEVTVKYNLKDALAISGGISGAPGLKTIQDHHQTNRFLTTSDTLRHNYTSGIFGQVELSALEGNRIFGGLSYQITKNYAYYDRGTEERIGEEYQLFYNINYDKASIFELYGGITQQLVPETFWFDARFYARAHSLDDGGDIPYEERLGLKGALSYRPISELTLTSWADYIGNREAPSVNEELDGFILVNAGAEYQINARFGLYLKALNILGQNYEVWDGYEERPFQIFGGLTIKL